ncbi:MAG: hypothetical protein AAGH76_02525 [Pseudomonadota bacterium]
MLKPWMTALAALVVAGPAAAQMENMETVMDALEQWNKAPIVELSDSDVTRFIALSTEAASSDVEFEGYADDKPITNYDAFATAMRENSKAMALLNKHGFNPESFRDVAINIAMSMGAIEMEENRPEMEQGLAQLESMKAMMPPDQYELLSSQIKGMFAAFERAPEGNIAVVREYKTELDAL